MDELLLDDLANALRKDHGEKRIALENIKRELGDPHMDRRDPFHVKSERDFFGILTGESEETLREGLIIPVEVKTQGFDPSNTRKALAVWLDSGLPGFIDSKNLPENPIVPGQTLLARILSVPALLIIIFPFFFLFLFFVHLEFCR